MNFSSLKNIYLAISLRVLGHHEPSDDFVATLSPRDKPPAATNGHVLERLKALPSLEGLLNLQAREERSIIQTQVDKRLKLFCCYAGSHQIRALDILTRLAYGLASLDHEHLTQPFANYECLVQAAIAIRKAHVAWEISIDEDAFFRRNPHPQTVRHEYLSYLLRVVYIILALAFPDEYQDSYVTSLEELLARDD